MPVNMIRPGKERMDVRCLGVLCLLLVWSAHAEPGPPIPNRILLKPRTGVHRQELSALHAKNGCKVHRRYASLGGLEVIELPGPSQMNTLLARYRSSELVEYAEPDSIVRGRYTPNDPRFIDGTLWSLHNTGLSGGKVDGDIDAPEAWDLQRDAWGIIVAVLDSGVRYTHQDLAANMWRNPVEVPGNRIDEDGNGYFTDIHGINAINGFGDPMDDHGHGTHVAGIIGAVGGNAVGAVGVAYRVRIMALKCLDAGLYGLVSDVIECIDYARAKGARVINASWGDYNIFTSTALRDAIARARDSGIIFVAAASNEGSNNDAVNFYPANYDVNNIIAVAATTRTDVLAAWSNYGSQTVDLGAPGDSIFSTWNSGDAAYNVSSGTSMAVPHVAGACALVWARFPSLSYSAVIQRVLSSVDPLPSLAGKTVTGGRLNLRNALSPINSPPVLAFIGNRSVNEGTSLTFTVSATDADGGPLTFSLDGGAPAGATINSTTGSFSWTPGEAQGPSTYTVTIRVTDNGGLTDAETITITVNDINGPPVLATIGNRTVNEGAQLTFTATASDSDLPVQGLAFSLDPGAPAGATVNPATGVFTWTPTDSQGGTTHAVTIRVTDSGSPAASDFETFTITVAEINAPPALAAIPSQTVDEGAQLSFVASATDSDVPAQALSFGLAGAPAGASIHPATGNFTWTPTEVQGPSTNVIRILVTDNGSPTATATQAVTVVVNEINSPPVIAAIPNRTVSEGAQLGLTATANDNDLPAQALTFAIESAPVGATINPGTGIFTWTPGESQGGTVNLVRIRVSDNGNPSASATQSVSITVNEVNSPPLLSSIPNQTNFAGSTITFTATATDPDAPANSLSFSLTGGPVGAAINPATGTFSWTPTESQAPTTNFITVRIRDDGAPALEDSKAVVIVVFRQLRITSAEKLGANSMMLAWTSIPGKAYQLQAKATLPSAPWVNIGVPFPAVDSTTTIITSMDPYTTRFFRVVQTD
jgi:subtilisin family serine protease